MNAKKCKQLRRKAKATTTHLPEKTYTNAKTARLHECTRGAYRALKSGRFTVTTEAAKL
jgi:hypothetical protein